MTKVIPNGQESATSKATGGEPKVPKVPAGAMDLDSWKAAQARFMFALDGTGGSPSNNGATVIAEYEKQAANLKKILAAREKFSLQQQVTNIHVETDNYIKDSVTGK